MRRLVPLLFLVQFLAINANAQERDWTIEKPVLAGFLNGLTLSTCRFLEFGEQGVAADENDPFAMSPLVKEELKRLGKSSYLGATVFGAGCTFFVIAGVFFRRLNRLKLQEIAGLA
jgi:hypothetical protein